MTLHKLQYGVEMAGVLERQECIKISEGLDIEGEKKKKFKDEYWFPHVCRIVHALSAQRLKIQKRTRLRAGKREIMNIKYCYIFPYT